MPESDSIEVGPDLKIPRAELGIRATRSGGPGGQHVNVTASRIELTWNVATSPSLTDEQRARLLERLASRLDGVGTLRLVESRRRSQYQNREAVLERFADVIAKALHRPPPRRKTRRTPASERERLKQKRRRADRKRRRARPLDED